MSGTSSRTSSSTSAEDPSRRRSPERDSIISASPTRIVLLAQRAGDVDDALLVGVRDDQRAVVVQQLLEDHDLALALELADGDDVERLVEHDLLAGLEGLDRRSTG
jgi:hypothetical protein